MPSRTADGNTFCVEAAVVETVHEIGRRRNFCWNAAIIVGSTLENRLGPRIISRGTHGQGKQLVRSLESLRLSSSMKDAR